VVTRLDAARRGPAGRPRDAVTLDCEVSMTKPSIADRRAAIAKLVNLSGYASNEYLAEHFAVSTQTVRRDIRALARENLVSRHHGGAGPVSSVVNTSYDARRVSRTAEKRLLGQAVTGLLRDGASLFITPGTTMEFFARELTGLDRLCVITNNLHAAMLLHNREEIELILPCGRVRAKNGAIVGASALSFLADFYVDFLVTSVGAIAPDGTLLDYDVNEVALVQRMMRNAKKIVLAADQTKFERSAVIKVGHIRDVSAFVTDRPPPPAISDILGASGVQLVLPGTRG
jgi:DeoR/GlpR family transcriptional regulator of sugar metabolism